MVFRTFQTEILQREFAHVHGIPVLQLKWSLLNLCNKPSVFCRQLSFKENCFRPHGPQVVRQHHICYISRRYGSQMFHSNFPRCVNGSALNGKNRAHAALHRFSHYRVEMACVKQIIAFSVVAAERQGIKKPDILHSVPDCLHIFSDGALSGIHVHTASQLL